MNKRLAEKKKRDEERKLEEERQKKEEDERRKIEGTLDDAIKEASEAIAVSPEDLYQRTKSGSQGDESIDRLLHSGGADMDIDIEEIDAKHRLDTDDAQRLPSKQKARFANRILGIPKSTTAAKNVSKETPKSSTATQPKKSSMKAAPPHKYKHPRSILESSIQLPLDKPEGCIIDALKELLRNGQIIDKHFAFVPIKSAEGAKLITEANSIPNNMTILSKHFKISYQGNRNPFEKQKVWGKNKKDKEKDEFREPTVYFSMAIAMDKEPAEVLERINQEWFKQGGQYLRVKELQTFDSKTILTLFNLSIQVPKKCLLEEYKVILTDAQKLAKEMQIDNSKWDANDWPENGSFPELELRLQVPKLPGQDVSHFNKLEYRVSNNRRAYHVSCDKRYSNTIKRLTQIAKEFHIVTNYWGRHAHISEVADNESTPSEIKRLCKVAQAHTNYQISLLVEDIQGITNLNESADIYHEAGAKMGGLTLRNFLLTKFKLKDGFQLIAEVHQSSAPMSPVQAVIPHTPEAEKMILMLNKNFPAFLTFVLRDQHFPESTIQEYVKRCCCQTMAAEINQCKWDSDSAILTTPKDLRKKTTDDFVSASWYKDAFADLRIGIKGKKNLPPPTRKPLQT